MHFSNSQKDFELEKIFYIHKIHLLKVFSVFDKLFWKQKHVEFPRLFSFRKNPYGSNPMEGHRKFRGGGGGGGGGVLQAKILVVMYELKLNWNFLGRGVWKPKPAVGEYGYFLELSIRKHIKLAFTKLITSNLWKRRKKNAFWAQKLFSSLMRNIYQSESLHAN